jgi:RNA polymerase sigma-70 factor (ECF subfamily)
MYSEFTDNQLVEDYVENSSKEAFQEIFTRYFKYTYRYVFGRVGQKEACEDIVSETFLTLISVIKNFDNKAKLSTFIIGIAINKMRQHFANKSKQNETKLDNECVFLEDNATLEEDDKKSKIAIDVRPLLAGLPDNYRQVLTARFLDCKSIRETAKELSLSLENVRVIQFRALTKLKKLLIGTNL